MTGKTVSIPLRGSIPCNKAGEFGKKLEQYLKSQSPYGAQSLATEALYTGEEALYTYGRNPLTGLNPLQHLKEAKPGPSSLGRNRRNPLTGLNPLQPLVEVSLEA